MLTRKLQAVKDDSEHEAMGFLGPLSMSKWDAKAPG
jgi:hypothetical protein